MTEPKFTPTTWSVTANGLNVKNVELDKIICFTGNETIYKESEANANLIAAAPELYDVLEMVTNHLEFDGGDKSEAIRQARQTLAKARGE